MLVMAHATPLYRGAGYVEQISWSQLADARSPSSVCSYAVPHVSENARGPTEPAHLSPGRAGDEKQIQ